MQNLRRREKDISPEAYPNSLFKKELANKPDIILKENPGRL